MVTFSIFVGEADVSVKHELLVLSQLADVDSLPLVHVGILEVFLLEGLGNPTLEQQGLVEVVIELALVLHVTPEPIMA